MRGSSLSSALSACRIRRDHLEACHRPTSTAVRKVVESGLAKQTHLTRQTPTIKHNAANPQTTRSNTPSKLPVDLVSPNPYRTTSRKHPTPSQDPAHRTPRARSTSPTPSTPTAHKGSDLQHANKPYTTSNKHLHKMKPARSLTCMTQGQRKPSARPQPVAKGGRTT